MLIQLKSVARRGIAVAGLAFLGLASAADNIVAPPPLFDPNPPATQWTDPAKLQAALDEKIALLSSVAIHEKIVRYSQTGNTVRQLDTLDTDVDVIDGAERYSGVRRNSVALAHTSEIKGAWSFGEVVTLLRGARDALARQALDTRATIAENGSPVVRIAFYYPSSSHRWFVSVDSRVYWLDFQGKIWISPVTGDILRISWESTAAPPPASGVASVVWTVDFHSAAVGGLICTMPETGIYRVNHSVGDAWSEWNVMNFSGIGRYGSQVKVVFDRQ
jgi:hypothetical protein